MKAVETVGNPASCVACGAELQAARCGHCGAAAVVRGYQVRRVLAQQPHSRVYLAALSEGAAVVLKELTFSFVPDAQTLEAFHREAGMLRQLSHPQLPTFLEAFQEGTGVGTRLYLGMTYVEGRSLQQELETHRFSESEVLDIAARALELLVYLHGLSPPVLHRDVKPANLLRRPDGTLSLVDFGAAREVRRATAGQATLVGTVGYMPPEQLVGAATPGGDIYALGATLVHLLSRTSPGELMGPDLRLEFKQRVNLGAPALEWLTKLVHPQPRRRFASAAQALEALRAVRSGKAGRRRVLSRVGQGLAAVAVAVGGLILLRPVDTLPVAAPAVKSPPPVLLPGAELWLRITCPAGTTLSENSQKRMRWCSRPGTSGHPVRHGPFVSWDERGELTERSSYADDTLHGAQLLKQEGKKRSEGQWRQGKKTGSWVSYEDFGGYYKAREETYEDGVLDGPFRRFDSNGAPQEEGQYKAGQKQGVWLNHLGLGKESEATFVDGKRSGPFRSWHHSQEFVGQQGQYLDGRKTGPWVIYHGNGEKQGEGLYEADQQEGPWTTWHENGRQESQGTYVKGQRTGPWVEWFDNGQKKLEGTYDHGQPVGTWLEWYESGINRSVVIRQPDGLVRTTQWFPNGRMERRGAERGSRREGLWTEWFPNGRKESAAVYINGDIEGLSTSWFPNGHKKSEGRYSRGQQTGTCRWWRQDGSLEREERSPF